jgi:hypothetical protein
MEHEREIYHLDGGHEPNTFRVRRSLGLVWVSEHFPDEDVAEHGPFMDLPDAFEQCGRPSDWRVEYAA